MSVEALLWVANLQGLSALHNQLLTKICLFHEIETGKCSVDIRQLAQDVQLSSRSVENMLSELREARILNSRKVNSCYLFFFPTFEVYLSSLNHKLTEAQDFEEFWKAYPKKRNKKKAKVMWFRLNPTKELKDKIIAQVATRYSSTAIQFIPLPTTYLNGELWDDEIAVEQLTNEFTYL